MRGNARMKERLISPTAKHNKDIKPENMSVIFFLILIIIIIIKYFSFKLYSKHIWSQPKLEQEYWWDVARVTSRDFELEQMQLKSRSETFKILFKLIGYLIFFVIVLTSSVVSKLSLFTMVNAYKKVKQVRCCLISLWLCLYK
jgi:predicted nucleic acid-binding Zn ribbon protein